MGNFISKKGYEELQEQLKYLKNVKRKEISKAVGEAREHGDLRENAGYHEARKDQSMNEAKITELETKLENAEVLEDTKRANDVVSIGSKVKFKNLQYDEINEYTIVSEMEANILEKKISSETPMGSALLDAKKGETVEVHAPMGTFKIKVLEIS